jgi:hypothetical protein
MLGLKRQFCIHINITQNTVRFSDELTIDLRATKEKAVESIQKFIIKE